MCSCYIISKISYESSPEEIKKEIDRISYEMREEILHNQIQKVANDIEKNNGTVQVSFDEAMYMLRHYKNRSVISEDGRVFIGGVNVSRSQRNVFQEFKNDQQNLQKQKEKILLENTSDDEEIHVQSSNGLRVISAPAQGEKIKSQAQRFKEIFGAEYEQYLSIINENMKQKTQDQSENPETNFKRREIDSEVDSQEENLQNAA